MPIEKERSAGITNRKIPVNGSWLESGTWPLPRVYRSKRQWY